MELSELNMNGFELDVLARRYNRIRHIDQQYPSWHQDVPYEVLQQLGAIFHASGADKDFGLVLLHRHAQLPTGFVMVHSRDDLQRDICEMEAVGTREVFPSSYLLNDAQFFPYEFSAGRTPTPSPTLLHRLSECLRMHNLENTLGLANILCRDHLWLETIQLGGQRMVSESVPCEPKNFDTHFVQTEWAILMINDAYVLRAVKGCSKPEVGGHKPT